MYIAILDKDYDPKLTPIYFKFVSRIKMNNIVSEKENYRERERWETEYEIKYFVQMRN